MTPIVFYCTVPYGQSRRTTRPTVQNVPQHIIHTHILPVIFDRDFVEYAVRTRYGTGTVVSFGNEQANRLDNGRFLPDAERVELEELKTKLNHIQQTTVPVKEASNVKQRLFFHLVYGVMFLFC